MPESDSGSLHGLSKMVGQHVEGAGNPGVSVIAMSGLAFAPSTPRGRVMATTIAGIADFERELIQDL